jgi:uncharacterized Zn-finger protein
MTLAEPPEIVEVPADMDTVGCDGGGGALGHPLVYYTFGDRPSVDCNYCGRRFVHRGQTHGAAERAPR